MLGELIDGAVLAIIDVIETLHACFGRGLVSAFERGQRNRVHFMPEGICFLGDCPAQFVREHRIDIVRGPPLEAGAILLFEFGQFDAVLRQMWRIIERLPNQEHRLDDVERRRQDIGG